MKFKSINTFSQTKRLHTSAFTLVELMIVIVISLLLTGTIISFIVGVTDQFAVSAVRGQMNAQVVSATNRIENDVRYSRSILAENSVTDGAAPSNDSRWNSGPDQLVLGATARNNAKEPLDDNYTDSLDNYIYYLKDGTLYRRVLAFPSSSNRYTTLTCTQTATGGCSSDTAILRNVDSLVFKYYDNDGNETSDFDQATSVKLNITTRANQSRHTIELDNTAQFRLAMAATSNTTLPGIPSLPGTINSGYGGVEFSYSSTVNVNGDISTLGDLYLNSSNTVTANNIYVGHMNCGPTTSLKYGTLCPASPAPIRVGYQSKLTANSACSPNTPVASTTSSSAVISITNLTTSCSGQIPTSLPIFDKQALIDTIPTANTSPGITNCGSYPSGSVIDIPANHRYQGNITLSSSCSGRITGSGVLYIEGDLVLSFATLDIATSVTSPITIVVNGRVSIYNSKFGNSSAPKPNIISFESINSACSSSSSCNSLSLQDLYDSASRAAFGGIAVSHSLTEAYANFYAPFSVVEFYNTPKVETNEIYGQRVRIDIGNTGQLNFTP